MNNVSLKDSYHLPNLDALLDNYRDAGSTKLHRYLFRIQSNTNASNRRRQNFMAEIANYCYWVIPFNLKNANATYQCYCNLWLKEMCSLRMVIISKTIENH